MPFLASSVEAFGQVGRKIGSKRLNWDGVELTKQRHRTVKS
jgi:hypothetical protein